MPLAPAWFFRKYSSGWCQFHNWSKCDWGTTEHAINLEHPGNSDPVATSMSEWCWLQTQAGSHLCFTCQFTWNSRGTSHVLCGVVLWIAKKLTKNISLWWTLQFYGRIAVARDLHVSWTISCCTSFIYKCQWNQKQERKKKKRLLISLHDAYLYTTMQTGVIITDPFVIDLPVH